MCRVRVSTSHSLYFQKPALVLSEAKSSRILKLFSHNKYLNSEQGKIISHNKVKHFGISMQPKEMPSFQLVLLRPSCFILKFAPD